MNWLLPALLAATLDGAKHLYAKHLTKTFDEYLLAFTTAITAVAILLPLVAWRGIPDIQTGFTQALIITSAINAITLVLVLKALKHTDVSLAIPLFSLSPAFLLITSPLIIGERPGILGIVGVALILVGAYALNFKKHVNLDPLKEILSNPGQRLILIVTLLWAISSNYYKLGMQRSSPTFFILALYLTITVLLIPLILQKNRLATTKKHWKQLAPLGILTATTSIFQWLAASMTLVVYALSIKRLSILIAVIGGAILFKEPATKQRVLATLILLSGVLLITLA